jgi:hypothetical protein
MNAELKSCYEQIRQILGNDIEPYESVALVERYRQYWRPTTIRVILLAESHVFTSDVDRQIKIPQLPELAGYPTQYAKFVYCLGYGERQLTGDNSHPKRDGTPHFWKIFYSCDNFITDKNVFHPILSRTPFEQRLTNKIDLLRSLKKKGIWLVDSSIIALYNYGKKPSNNVISEVIKKSWECYTRAVIKEAHPEHIICIGKAVWNVLKDDIKEVVGDRCTHLKQPNARLRSEEHIANFRQYSEICSKGANLDRKLVVITYLMRGIEDFFVAFSKFDESFSRYAAFFNAMGFEMVTKAYLLATKSCEYEGLGRREADSKIDEIAKRTWGHDVHKLTKSIKEVIGEEKIQSILDQKYDG